MRLTYRGISVIMAVLWVISLFVLAHTVMAMLSGNSTDTFTSLATVMLAGGTTVLFMPSAIQTVEWLLIKVLVIVMWLGGYRQVEEGDEE
jgi:carbon starvation protein CstA